MRVASVRRGEGSPTASVEGLRTAPRKSRPVRDQLLVCPKARTVPCERLRLLKTLNPFFAQLPDEPMGKTAKRAFGLVEVAQAVKSREILCLANLVCDPPWSPVEVVGGAERVGGELARRESTPAHFSGRQLRSPCVGRGSGIPRYFHHTHQRWRFQCFPRSAPPHPFSTAPGSLLPPSLLSSPGTPRKGSGSFFPSPRHAGFFSSIHYEIYSCKRLSVKRS